jgi:hypothetical protein
MQGEQDAQIGQYAVEYPDNLNRIVCGLRWHSGYAQFVTVVGRQPLSSANSCCYTFPFLTTIRSAQAGVEDSTLCAYWLDMDTLNLNADSVHLSARAQLLVGYEAASLMEDCAFWFFDCFPCLMGDVNEDRAIDILDVSGTINVAFRGMAPPECNSYATAPRTDANCDGLTDVVDVISVVNIAFRGSPWNPCDPCDCYPYPSNCPEPCKRYD